MSAEILPGFSCEFVPESDSCKLVDTLLAENDRLREQGRETCHLEEIDKDCDTASEWMLDREWCIDAVYRCCSCGCLFGHVAYDRPRYCPACGRKVVDE